jgi:hypothetical protein
VCIVLESKHATTTTFEPNSGIVPALSDLYIVATHALAFPLILPPHTASKHGEPLQPFQNFTKSNVQPQDKPYGRNRQSIADIEESLYSILDNHPKLHPNPDGEPEIPADVYSDPFWSKRSSN